MALWSNNVKKAAASLRNENPQASDGVIAPIECARSWLRSTAAADESRQVRRSHATPLALQRPALPRRLRLPAWQRHRNIARSQAPRIRPPPAARKPAEARCALATS